MPATAVVAVAALSLGAYTGFAQNSARRHHKPTFKLTATPSKDTITAGSTAGYRLFIRRQRFPWAIRFSLRTKLPRGATARFTARRTFKSRSTLTIRTRAWTVPGVYQLTPLKRACLEHCRAPAHFISRHWRPGRAGAFVMGVRHGAYCVGCCWALMAVLFVGGVMNLLLIAAIAGFVLLEKTLPFAEIGGRIVGGAMAILGVAGLVLALT